LIRNRIVVAVPLAVLCLIASGAAWSFITPPWREIVEQADLAGVMSYKPMVTPRRPSPDTMLAMRFALSEPISSAPRDDRTLLIRWRAFETLSVYDPDAVVDHLMAWQPGDTDLDHKADGYGMTCLFAWRFRGDRASCLRRLLNARDPYVRVGAAIYMCFEDERAGKAALQVLSRERGEAGALAALNLARRGDKVAAQRAIEALQATPVSVSEERLHRNLQKRLIVLLSNAAKKSGVPQPGTPDRYALRDLRGWWERYQSRLRLRDPWLDDMESRKIQ
jgi:hypothetical protein